MRRRSLFLLTGSLSVLVLLVISSSISASPHAGCSISRIAYIPSLSNDAGAILIGHSHLMDTPENAKNRSESFRLRGVSRNFTLACNSPALIKTARVDASSLTAPPRYQSPDCVYPQHNYLFRLTPF